MQFVRVYTLLKEGQREEGRRILRVEYPEVEVEASAVVVVHSYPDIRTAAEDQVVVQGTPRDPEDIQGHLVGMAHHIHEEVQDVEAQVGVHLEEDMAREAGSHVDCEVVQEARYTGLPVQVGNNPVEEVEIGLKTQER